MSPITLRIQSDVDAELVAAQAAEARGEFHSAVQRMERAHVLGQASTFQHVRVHFQMLRFAMRNGRPAEVIGQAARLIAAPIFTASNVTCALDGAINIMLRQLLAIAVTAGFTALVSGCAMPANLDLSLDKSSATGVYRVALVPPAQAPAINQMHSWKVKLATPDGAPVHAARFAVDGGMPQHGHGLPTQPRVTRELEEGTYLLEGMKFSMTGWWEVKLDIQGPPGADKVTFNTVVETPTARR
jgi:hypothetical protein